MTPMLAVMRTTLSVLIFAQIYLKYFHASNFRAEKKNVGNRTKQEIFYHFIATFMKY